MAEYDKLLTEITGLTQDIETTGINWDAIPIKSIGSLTQSFWPSVKDAAKQMLRSRCPEITKEQADMIFDSEKELEAKDEEREKKRREKEEFKALPKEQQEAITEAEKAKRRAEREERRKKRREQRKEKIKLYKKIYDEKVKELKEEAKQMLRTIKDSLLKIVNGFIDIVKRLITAIILTATGIAGIIQIIVAPPWNVANAISQTMKIIMSYLDILKAIQELNPYFKIFQIIPIFVSKARIKILSTIFTPIIKGLRAFFLPIKLFNNLIIKLMNWIQSFLANNRAKIFRRATRKLKKLGHLYRFWLIDPKSGDLLPGRIRGDYYGVGSTEGVEYPCYAFEEEDIDEIQGLLDNFIVGFEGNKSQNRVVAYRRKFSSDASDLAKAAGFDFGTEIDFDSFDFGKLATDFEKIPNIETEVDPREDEDRFIYDIELPDGTIIQNVTEEGIEYYRENYILKYLNAVSQAIDKANASV
jgi:hypothetical protein